MHWFSPRVSPRGPYEQLSVGERGWAVRLRQSARFFAMGAHEALEVALGHSAVGHL